MTFSEKSNLYYSFLLAVATVFISTFIFYTMSMVFFYLEWEGVVIRQSLYVFGEDFAKLIVAFWCYKAMKRKSGTAKSEIFLRHFFLCGIILGLWEIFLINLNTSISKENLIPIIYLVILRIPIQCVITVVIAKVVYNISVKSVIFLSVIIIIHLAHSIAPYIELKWTFMNLKFNSFYDNVFRDIFMLVSGILISKSIGRRNRI